MSIRLIAIVILTMYSFSFTVGQRKSDAARQGYIGKVKEVRIGSGYTRFNEKGDLTEVYSPGSGCEKLVYTYNADGSRNVEGQCIYSGGISHPYRISYKESYKFDSAGRIIEFLACGIHTPDPGYSYCRSNQYTYSDRGYVVQIIEHDPTSKIERKGGFMYDTQGRMVAQTTCSDGKAGGTIIYTYDSNNHISESVAYYTEGSRLEHRAQYKYKFDAQGNIIETTTISKNVYYIGSKVTDPKIPESEKKTSYREETNTTVYRYTISYY